MKLWCADGRLHVGIVGILLALADVACGGSPGSPTPPPSGGGGGGTSGQATITLSNNGASPRTLEVALGTRVRFVNNDSRNHDMTSDPHPEHTDCPPLNDVGFIRPGETRETGNLVTARTCGFHDHDQPSNNNLRGTITIR